MIAMPVIINALRLSQMIAGAWIGGTVDSTGAVVVAGSYGRPRSNGSGRHSENAAERRPNRLRLFRLRFYWVAVVYSRGEGERVFGA